MDFAANFNMIYIVIRLIVTLMKGIYIQNIIMFSAQQVIFSQIKTNATIWKIALQDVHFVVNLPVLNVKLVIIQNNKKTLSGNK